MGARAYIETSVVSYLTSKPSRDVVVAAHQQISMHWWEHCRKGFDLCTSQLVIDEARRGDPEVAQRRLGLLHDMSLLRVTDQARALATTVVQEGLLSPKSF